MRRHPNAFITHMGNRLAAIVSDAREAERAEHIGRMPEVEQYLLSIDQQLQQVCEGLAEELDRRCLSPVFQELKGKSC